jgi:cell division transport system ATP-binding protein
MIRLENVTKSYSTEIVAVRDASFDVAKGEFVFLVGPSGSGKSTLLRMLNRQDRPERGAVWVAGRNIVDMPPSRVPHLRRNIGNIFQDYKLLLEKSVFENVAFAPGGHRATRTRDQAAGAGRPGTRRSRRQGRPAASPALRR